MNLAHQIKVFTKRNSSTILTVVGAAGVVATSVAAVKATPKAVALIEKAKQEKGEELTKTEIVKVAAPVYIPSILIGASTIACIFGASALNKRQQAAMMSAYALLDNSYKEYKKKVHELYEDSEGLVEEEIVKDKLENENIIVENEKRLFFDYFSNRYFESTIEDVQRAEYRLNRTLIMHEGCSLNEFYDMLGIDRVEYGDEMGWTRDMCMDMYWQTWIDFNHKKTVLDDGLECHIIHMDQEPVMRYYDFY